MKFNCIYYSGSILGMLAAYNLAKYLPTHWPQLKADPFYYTEFLILLGSLTGAFGATLIYTKIVWNDFIKKNPPE